MEKNNKLQKKDENIILASIFLQTKNNIKQFFIFIFN
jgi:hypothetical protein